MRKSILLYFLLFLGVSTLVLQSCKDDGYLRTPAPVSDQSFVEEFDTATSALQRGWKFVNNSDPRGTGIWQNGGDIAPWFRAYSNKGTYAGFIGTDFTSTSAAAGLINNWLVSPSLILQNGDKIIFYTRALQYDDGAGDSTDYGNSLRLTINTTDDINIITGTDVGHTQTTLITINPTLLYSSKLHPVVNAYPTRWTRFEGTVSGLKTPARGHFSFNYNVVNGGSNGNGSGVAIDSVAYKSVGH